MQLWKPGRVGRQRADQAYATIREDIVAGRRAAGSLLAIDAIMAAYGVTRGNARDILQRLAIGGLVVSTQGEAAVIAEADLAAARDAQLVVAKMHGLAALLAVPQLRPGDIQEMREANRLFGEAMRLGDVDAALAADVELHDIPVRLCGNHTVIAVLDQYQPLIVRLERMRFESWDVDDAIEQHARLVDVCAAGDAQAAAEFAEEMWHSLDDATPEQFRRPRPNPARRGQPRANPAHERSARRHSEAPAHAGGPVGSVATATSALG